MIIVDELVVFSRIVHDSIAEGDSARAQFIRETEVMDDAGLRQGIVLLPASVDKPRWSRGGRRAGAGRRIDFFTPATHEQVNRADEDAATKRREK